MTKYSARKMTRPLNLPAVRFTSPANRAAALRLAEDLEPYDATLAERLRHLVALAESAPLSRRLEYTEAWRDGCPTPEEIEKQKTEIRNRWPEERKDSETF